MAEEESVRKLVRKRSLKWRLTSFFTTSDHGPGLVSAAPRGFALCAQVLVFVAADSKGN